MPREKKPERKRKNLMRLGVNPEDAYPWSRTLMEGWRVAQSPILKTTNYLSSDEETGLYRHVGPLSPNQANVTNRRIRDPYVRWCERRTVSLWLTVVYSIIPTIIFLTPNNPVFVSYA